LIFGDLWGFMGICWAVGSYGWCRELEFDRLNDRIIVDAKTKLESNYNNILI
jgi:hypothetical protein